MSQQPSYTSSSKCSPLQHYHLYQADNDNQTIQGLWQGSCRRLGLLRIDKLKNWKAILEDYDAALAEAAGPSNDGGSLNEEVKCAPIVIYEHMLRHGISIFQPNDVTKDVLDTEKIMTEYVVTKLWQERKIRYMTSKHGSPYNTTEDFSAFIRPSIGQDYGSSTLDVQRTKLADKSRDVEFKRLGDVVDYWYQKQREALDAPIFNGYHRAMRQQEATQRELAEMSREFERASLAETDTEMHETPDTGDSSTDRRHFG